MSENIVAVFCLGSVFALVSLVLGVALFARVLRPRVFRPMVQTYRTIQLARAESQFQSLTQRYPSLLPASVSVGKQIFDASAVVALYQASSLEQEGDDIVFEYGGHTYVMNGCTGEFALRLYGTETPLSDAQTKELGDRMRAKSSKQSKQSNTQTQQHGTQTMSKKDAEDSVSQDIPYSKSKAQQWNLPGGFKWYEDPNTGDWYVVRA